MFRVLIAEDDPSHPSLVPDGIYGPETMAAVSISSAATGWVSPG